MQAPQLPPEVLHIIFSRLSRTDLTQCTAVCRSWWHAARDERSRRARRSIDAAFALMEESGGLMLAGSAALWLYEKCPKHWVPNDINVYRIGPTKDLRVPRGRPLFGAEHLDADDPTVLRKGRNCRYVRLAPLHSDVEIEVSAFVDTHLLDTCLRGFDITRSRIAYLTRDGTPLIGLEFDRREVVSYNSPLALKYVSIHDRLRRRVHQYRCRGYEVLGPTAAIGTRVNAYTADSGGMTPWFTPTIKSWDSPTVADFCLKYIFQYSSGFEVRLSRGWRQCLQNAEKRYNVLPHNDGSFTVRASRW